MPLSGKDISSDGNKCGTATKFRNKEEGKEGKEKEEEEEEEEEEKIRTPR